MEPGDRIFEVFTKYSISNFSVCYSGFGQAGGSVGLFHCKQIKLTKNTAGKNLGGSNRVY